MLSTSNNYIHQWWTTTNITFYHSEQNIWLLTDMKQAFNHQLMLKLIHLYHVVQKHSSAMWDNLLKVCPIKQWPIDFFNVGRSRPLFVYFCPFHITVKFFNWKKRSIDAVLGFEPGPQDCRRRRIHWTVVVPNDLPNCVTTIIATRLLWTPYCVTSFLLLLSVLPISFYIQTLFLT